MNVTGVQAYALINARVRGMSSKLLDSNDWNRLDACNNLDSLISVLRTTEYGTYLTGMKEGMLTTRRAAFEIRKWLTNATWTIINKAPEFARPLLNQFFQINEVDNLKATLRGIQLGATWDTIRFMLFPLEGYTTLPFQKMMETGNIPDAVDLLSGTRYRRVLAPAIERYKQENSLFPIEVALDLDHWQETWNQVNALPRPDREIARGLIGLIIDKDNLTWAARYRTYHHLSESEIINYTLPFGNRVNDEIIHAVASGIDLIPIVRKVFPELADTIETSTFGSFDLALIETLIQRLILSKCRLAYTGVPFNIGVLLAYIIQLEFEVHDLTLLIEAKSMDIKPSVYQPYMINLINKAGKK
jgi:vacuolar-type H+-ATPase subunit C/Vma6